MPEDEPLDQDAIDKAFEAGFEDESADKGSPEGESPQPDAPEADTPEADAPEADAPEADAPEADISEFSDEGSIEATGVAGGEASVEPSGSDGSTQSESQAPDAGVPTAFSMPEIATPGSKSMASEELDLLSDVDLNVKIELGRTRMLVEDVLRLGQGSVVELDKLAGDPVDVYVNERLVARGEILVLNDNFCVRINELVTGEHQDGKRKSA